MELLLPTYAADLSETQKAWLYLCQRRIDIFDTLQKQELQIQNILGDIVAGNNLPKVQQAIKEASKQFSELKETRLTFTRLIDEKLISKSMEFEKRTEELINAAKEIELKLRKQQAEKVGTENEKLLELQQLKAHIKNENIRLQTEYKSTLLSLINSAYTQCLEDKKPPAQLQGYLDGIAETMRAIKTGTYTRFDLKLVSKAEAQAAFKEVGQYTGREDLNTALVQLIETFSMYNEDLQNTDAALKAQEQKANELKREAERELQIHTATNNLLAHNATALLQAPVIKKRSEIIIENTNDWLLHILTAYIKNFATVNEYIKVKELSNLNLKQIGAALAKLHDETGTNFDGLTFKTIEK